MKLYFLQVYFDVWIPLLSILKNHENVFISAYSNHLERDYVSENKKLKYNMNLKLSN